MKGENIEKRYQRIPESLRRRRGERAAITIWFGILPLLIGFIGVFNYFTKKEEFFTGIPSAVFYKENCGKEIIHKNCLYFIINTDTIRALLSDKESAKYLNLIPSSDSTLQQDLKDIPKYDKLRIKLSEQKNRRRKLLQVQDHITNIELKYVNQVVKSLTINNIKIISYKSALWWGVFLVLIGIGWIVVHLNFFIKDPYGVYKDNDKNE